MEENETIGITVTKKRMSGSTLAIVIIVAVFTFPIWISIIGTLFGLGMGLLGATFGVFVGFGAGGFGCIVGGVAALITGLVKILTVPITGAMLIAAGLIAFGVGCLLLAVAGVIVQFAVWLVKQVIQLFNRLYHGRKGATV